jgi:hypothetical protein
LVPTCTIRPANRVAVLLVARRARLVVVEQDRRNHPLGSAPSRLLAVARGRAAAGLPECAVSWRGRRSSQSAHAATAAAASATPSRIWRAEVSYRAVKLPPAYKPVDTIVIRTAAIWFPPALALTTAANASV